VKHIIEYYKNGLGIDLTDLSHPISKKISSISEVSEQEKIIKKHHLKILGLALIYIKNYNENIYKTYLKRIVNNKDISIHGHIFEIKQCAHFIETCKNEKLEFKFGNANLNEPDFIINNCGFEITSIRFSEETVDINPGNKLLNTFRNKNVKKYANSSTSLVIDISEATYQTFEKKIPVSLSLNDVKEIMKKEMNFGAILCLIDWIEKKDNKFKSNCIVYEVYSDNCQKELKDIIENKFTKGRMDFEKNNEIFISSN
jgi:hypothetical protein